MELGSHYTNRTTFVCFMYKDRAVWNFLSPPPHTHICSLLLSIQGVGDFVVILILWYFEVSYVVFCIAISV